MKNNLFLLVAITLITFGCQSKQKHTSDFDNLQKSLVSPDSSIINDLQNELNVYYFHNTRRCATCNAVEDVTKESLKEFYGTKVKFTSLNLEEEAGETLAKSLKISGQSLIVKYGAKQIDLTNEAFMYARENPEKLQKKIKATIDPFL